MQGVTTGTLEMDTGKAFGLARRHVPYQRAANPWPAVTSPYLDNLQAANGNEGEDATRLWELWLIRPSITAGLISKSASRASIMNSSSASIPACSSIRWQVGRCSPRPIYMAAARPIRSPRSARGCRYKPADNTTSWPACSMTIRAAARLTMMRRRWTPRRALQPEHRRAVHRRAAICHEPAGSGGHGAEQWAAGPLRTRIRSASGTIQEAFRTRNSARMDYRLRTRPAMASR